GDAELLRGQCLGGEHRQRLQRGLRRRTDRAPVARRARGKGGATGAHQMSTLVFEPVGGIAGDMVIAALLHLGAPRAALDEGLRLDALAPGRIVALPPPSGGGTALTAHGVIPVPAPATLEVLRGRTLRPSGPGERTTPTGAAILAAWTEESPTVPELTVDRIGYGAGTRRWEDAPNLLRAM